MDKNLSNLLAIFGRFSDTYTFVSLAFSNNVEWYPGQTFSSSAISVTDGSAAVILEFSFPCFPNYIFNTFHFPLFSFLFLTF